MPARTSLKKLKDNDANERNARRRGPKPKPLRERNLLEVKPIQRVERSYTRVRKVQVLMWLKHYRLPNHSTCNTAVKMRPPTLDEASAFFQIPKSTIAYWSRAEITEKILASGKHSRRALPAVFLCMWPEMETKLFNAFVVRRELGRPVRDSWFRKWANNFWKQSYTGSSGELDSEQLEESHESKADTETDSGALFVFSRGWFHGFLSRHRIVLRFVTNTAQSLPSDYKEQILVWLRFNRRNRILTPLISARGSESRSPESQSIPQSLSYICNDIEGGIPAHRICNVDETPLPWEYLIGRTYNLQGARTVWSKSAESGTEKRQCTLFLCVFADGVPRVPPILIFAASTGAKICKKESHLWDSRVHVEFTPTGWMNEGLFTKFIEKYLVPLFGDHRSLFVYDRYRAHLTPLVIQTCRDHNIIPSLIPAGTTPMTQPLDVAMNKPFKALIKEYTEELREQQEEEENIDKWSMSQHRVVTTKAVGHAWEEWHNSVIRRKIVIKSFRDTGISLPVDGSCDHELNIKGFDSNELVIGDWARSEEEAGYGISESENAVLPPTGDSVEYRLQDSDE